MVVDLGHNKVGWRKVKIPEVLFFQEGPGVRKWQFTNKGVKLLNVGNINNGKVNLDTTKLYISEEEANDRYSHFLVDAADLLIACSGIVVDNFHNKIAFAGAEHLPLCLNTSTMRFKPLDESEIDLNFFKYYLQTVYFKAQLQRLITGSAQLNFGPSHIKKIDLPLPPLETQKKIAEILDTADALRKKTQQIIEHYDQLAQSIFLDMFGDLKGETFKLKECCEINPKKSEIAEISKNTLVSFIPMANVSDQGELALKEERRLEEVWSGFTFFREGDVVFAKITPCMENGKGCIMRGLKNKIGFGTTEFHVLRPKKGITNSSYIYFLTKTKEFRKKAELNMSGSAGQKRVPKDFIENYNIICPPIELQNQFAEKIELIEKQKELAKQSLQQSEDLFNALLQKAFKGELVS